MPVKFNLSPNQERFVLTELATKQSFALPKSYLIDGELDLEKLKNTLQKVINTYDGLRIRLTLGKSDQIEQSVNAKKDAASIDYIEQDSYDPQSIRSKITSYFYADNSLFEQPLVKFQIIRVDHQKHIFTFSIHHVIADGHTLQLFVRALNAAWNNENFPPFPAKGYFETLSENSLLKLPDTENTELERYWSNYLAGASQNSIPSDYAEPIPEKKYGRYTLIINKELTNKISILAKTLNVSVFNVFYASYLIVLSRHLGESDICTSFQSSGRQGLKDAKNVFGLFSRALLLRENIQWDMTASQLFRQLRKNVQACIDHQRYPYHHIIQSSGVQAKYAINWYPIKEKLTLEGLRITPYDSGVEWSSGFDLNLHCLQLESGIEMNMRYQQGVLDSSRIQILLEQIEHILLQAITDPNQTIAELSLILPRDSNLLSINTLSNKENALIYGKFLDQAAQFPDKTAIEYEQKNWTYAELNDISTKFGCYLLSRGVKSHAKVAIIANRCASMIAGMLATSKIGASFAVLDASYPNDRLKALLELIQADHIVICGEPESLNLALLDTKAVTRISEQLDSDDQILAGIDTPADMQISHNNPQSIAYYLFTSGTTGVPKCIPVSHSPLCHFVKWQTEHFSLDHNDRFTLISGVSHDPVLRDIFTPLSIGASIIIPEQKTIYDAARLYAWFAASRVTVSHITPPMTKIIHAGLSKNTPLYDLRYLFTGGDMLQRSHIRNIRQFAPQALLVNFYGTTETPQAVAYHCVNNDSIDKKIPIGKAIADVQVLILNNQSQPAGLYEQGQVVIRSKYLSEGYIGSSQSNANFSNDIFSNDSDIHLYFTGDYGYYNSDYQVVLLGRQDDQIKIRGYRIELNEINQTILNHSPEIEDALTIATELPTDSNESQEKQLVTYVVKKTGGNINTNTVHSMLSNKLPSYMIPSHIMLIESLPLLPNGKIDRKKLPLPDSSSLIRKSDNYEMPETETENEIALAWGKILGITEVGKNHTFIELGGDSLSHIQASLTLEKIIGHIPDEWETKPVSQLALDIKTSTGWIDIDSTIVVRAISIVAVVTGHFWIDSIRGATSALFMVAGYTFAKFQLKTIHNMNSTRPIFSTILAILLPASLINLVHVIYRNNYYLPKILFFNNFIVKNSSWWFIEVLIQILLLLAIILSFKKIRNLVTGKKAYHVSLYMLLAGCLLAIVMQHVWNTDYLKNMVPQQKIWMFFFGWFAYCSLIENKKATALALAITLPTIVTGQIDYMFTLGAILVLLAPKLKMLAQLYKPIYIVAASSLMIYLTHMQIKNGFLMIGINPHPSIQIVISVIGGIVIWHTWEKLRFIKRKSLQ